MITNLRVELPSDTGSTKTSYLEVKTFSGNDCYLLPTERGVRRRDLDVHQGYVKNGRKADLKHY